ncbi:hypothetical protein FQA39_LY17850 [Lamprigera yunnana]|nr:hypothetical protein FQA39_LY17850 [Lamprigera yunnana]
MFSSKESTSSTTSSDYSIISYFSTQHDDSEIYEDIAMEKSQLLDHLELHWTETMSLKVLVDSLKQLIASTIEQKDLEGKRLWSKMLSNLKDLLKKMKRQKIPIDSAISYDSFVGLLKSEELYTTLYIIKLNDLQMTRLEERLKAAAGATSSSSAGIQTTSTSCTTVPTQTVDAAAPELQASGDLTSQIEALFGLTESETPGGGISQYISLYKNGATNTLRSERAVGTEVVKLEVYPLKDVIGLPKELVEEGDGKIAFQYTVPCGSHEIADEPVNSTMKPAIDKRRCKKRVKEDVFIDWLHKYPTSPLLNIFKTKFFYDSPFVFWDIRKFRNKQAFHLYTKEFINLTTKELYVKYNNSVRLYNSPNGDVSDYYYTLEESLEIMEKVILYQC